MKYGGAAIKKRGKQGETRRGFTAKSGSKAAELGDKERERQYDWQKEQLRGEQLNIEARLKTVMGSGL